MANATTSLASPPLDGGDDAMIIAIKVAMTLMIAMGQTGSLNRPWQTSQNHPIFAFLFNFVCNQL